VSTEQADSRKTYPDFATAQKHAEIVEFKRAVKFGARN
jgi:hypothetical protein